MGIIAMKPAAAGKIVAFAVAGLLAAGPVLAASATDVVPVDISMIELEGGKGIAFQNTFAQPFYTYDRDQPGHSNCNDKCAETWIPVYPADRSAVDLGVWTLVPRTDGYKQWAYHGKPLYTFGYGEHAPPTPKEMGAQWHVLTP
jgi:predicted lipoprotein with Yx(FWY)xxD motif